MYVGVQNECLQLLCIQLMSVTIVHVHFYIVSVMCSVDVCFPSLEWTGCSSQGCIWRPYQHYPVPCTKDAVSAPQHNPQWVHHATLCSSRRPCWNGSISDRWVQIEPHCSYQGVWSVMQVSCNEQYRASSGLCNACGRCACDRCVWTWAEIETGPLSDSNVLE